jgi:probable rRNA maturation factor
MAFRRPARGRGPSDAKGCPTVTTHPTPARSNSGAAGMTSHRRRPVIDLDIAIEGGEWTALGDPEALARAAVEAALAAAKVQTPVSLSLFFTDDAAVRALNRDWRGEDKPTNVLSFPAPPAPSAGPRHLGDVVLAFETLAREAAEGQKPFAHHATHLLVHGVLHLLGHDHEDDSAAGAMEALEVAALAGLGIADPYREAA